MKFYITPHEQYISLDNTAELILACSLVKTRYGCDHYLAERLTKQVKRAIYSEQEACATYSGEEQQLVVEALHYRVMEGEDGWQTAQAQHMLAGAI